jgi:hypothetical protein
MLLSDCSGIDVSSNDNRGQIDGCYVFFAKDRQYFVKINRNYMNFDGLIANYKFYYTNSGYVIESTIEISLYDEKLFKKRGSPKYFWTFGKNISFSKQNFDEITIVTENEMKINLVRSKCL